jgi:hypothetical protein
MLRPGRVKLEARFFFGCLGRDIDAGLFLTRLKQLLSFPLWPGSIGLSLSSSCFR